MHDTLFEKFRTKFRFKKTLIKFQSNADDRCKVFKQLINHKTNIKSVFTTFFHDSTNCYVVLTFSWKYMIEVTNWSVQKKNRDPDPLDSSPRWAPGTYFGILIRQGLFMDEEFGQDLQQFSLLLLLLFFICSFVTVFLILLGDVSRGVQFQQIHILLAHHFVEENFCIFKLFVYLQFKHWLAALICTGGALKSFIF